MQEIWKDVVGYEGYYQVSNMGKIKSLKKQIILKPYYVSIKNYLAVDLYTRGEKKRFRVHRLVAEHFIENVFLKEEVNHINGIKDDNRVQNLEWCTHKENMKHSLDNLLRYSKLKPNEVLEIKKQIKKGKKLKDIAILYNVHYGTISAIKTEKSWSWLKLNYNK